MKHELKIWPKYYDAVRNGIKRFEVRRMDRFFQVGDTLVLSEWCDGDNNYTGRELEVSVTYLMKGGEYGIDEKSCVMGIEVLREIEE